MVALEACGQATAALTWSAAQRIGDRDAAALIASRKLKAVALERFNTLTDKASSLWRSIKLGRLARRRRAQLARIEFSGVALQPILRESFRHFFVTQLPARLRYATALTRALENARPSDV